MKEKFLIGRMRRRVTIQSPQKTEDGMGGHTISWSDVAEVWAEIEPLRGTEYFYAHQIKNEVSHRVRIRFRSDITEEMRIKLGDRVFNIESILDIEEAHRFLEILCIEEK